MCRFSDGRLDRHAELNEVTTRALQTSRVPCLLHETTVKRSLNDHYQFEAVANQTAGTYSEGKKNTVRDIGRRLTEATVDQRDTFWFMQILSLACQRGNAASFLYGERERQCYLGI